jgi:hypothetical protein
MINLVENQVSTSSVQTCLAAHVTGLGIWGWVITDCLHSAQWAEKEDSWVLFIGTAEEVGVEFLVSGK